jgi:hypothetical protein
LLGALAACALLAGDAAAQAASDKTPPAQPARASSGSCMYDGNGRLVFSPRGASCPQFASPPAHIAPVSKTVLSPPPAARATQPGVPVSVPRSAVPQQLRVEVATLLAERERLDVELARIREAISYEDREAARSAVDQALAKISHHLEREARVLQPLAGAP